MNIESRWATNEENKPIALCTTASSVFLEDGTSLENYLKTIGGEDGNGFYIEKLLDGNMTEVGEYDLLNNIDNYDMIVVTADVVLSDSHEQLASLVIMKEDYYYQGAENCGHAINSSINGSTRRIIFYFSSRSKINIVLNEKLALKKIYGIKSNNNFYKYSENEQIVGKWIDGKNLYERVFQLSISQTLGTGAYINTDIDCSHMDKIIEYSLIGTYSGNGITENCSFTPYNVLKWTNNKIHIAFSNFNDGGIFNIEYMILKYTKNE